MVGVRPKSTRRWNHHISVTGSTCSGSGSVKNQRTAHSPIAMSSGARSLSGLGQVVLVAVAAAAGIRSTTPLRSSVPQPPEQQRAGDPRQPALDLVEASAADDRHLAQDQRGPAIAEDARCQRDGAVLTVVTALGSCLVTAVGRSKISTIRHGRSWWHHLRHDHHLTTTHRDAEREAELVAWATTLGEQIARHARRHDRDGTFVDEAYELLRPSGYLALAVPTELGGRRRDDPPGDDGPA